MLWPFSNIVEKSWIADAGLRAGVAGASPLPTAVANRGDRCLLHSSRLLRGGAGPDAPRSGPLEPAPRPPARIPGALVAPDEITAAQTAAHHRGAAALPMPRPRPAQLAPAPNAPTRALLLIPDASTAYEAGRLAAKCRSCRSDAEPSGHDEPELDILCSRSHATASGRGRFAGAEEGRWL